MRLATIPLWFAAAFVYLFTAGAAGAVDVLVSGGDVLLVIDVDDDGPDETEDCRYRVTLSGSRYTITAVQDPVTLRACTGNFFLDLRDSGQDDSSDWAEFDKSSSGVDTSGRVPGFPGTSGFLTEPYEIEIIDESGHPDGPPLDMNWIRFEDPPGGDNVRSEFFICDNNGPVLAVEVIEDLLVMHAPLVPYPTASEPDFVTLRNVPFERAPPDAGALVNLDVYLPVTDDGHFTIANATTPDEPFIDIDTASLTDCDSLINLEPPEPVVLINSAMSDAWFNPDTSGQGFFIIVWEGTKQVFLSWFTFETGRPPPEVKSILGEPGHRWLTAQGEYIGDAATLDVYLTEGGIFNQPVPPAATRADPIGTIVIQWTGCNAGTLTYDLPALELAGEIPIQRIVLDNVPACLAAQAQ